MLTVATPNQNVCGNTNQHLESDRPLKLEKIALILVAKEVSFTPTLLQSNQFWIHIARKSREKFSRVITQMRASKLAQEVLIPF